MELGYTPYNLRNRCKLIQAEL
ncbi:TPA: XRE family transcriptional regulator, partial [Neisseria meningitidis]